MDSSLERIPEKIDAYLKPSSGEVIEVAESVASAILPFVSSIRPVLNAADHYRFSYLLAGLKGHGNLDEKINKVYEYVSTPERAEYVASLFRQALCNTSHIANAMMGVQLSKLTGSNSEVSQLDMVIFEALVAFNDFDIKNYKAMYELTKEHPFETNEGPCINEEKIRETGRYEQFKITICKSERVGLLNYLPSVTYEDTSGMTTMASGSYYMLNSASDLFYRTICEVHSLLGNQDI